MYRRSSLLALLSSTELIGPVVRAGPIDAQSEAAHYGSRGPPLGDRTAGLNDGLSIPHQSDVRRHAEKANFGEQFICDSSAVTVLLVPVEPATAPGHGPGRRKDVPIEPGSCKRFGAA
jgi:hypothetical protein